MRCRRTTWMSEFKLVVACPSDGFVIAWLAQHMASFGSPQADAIPQRRTRVKQYPLSVESITKLFKKHEHQIGEKLPSLCEARALAGEGMRPFVVPIQGMPSIRASSPQKYKAQCTIHEGKTKGLCNSCCAKLRKGHQYPAFWKQQADNTDSVSSSG